MTKPKAKDDPTIWEVDDALWERLQPLDRLEGINWTWQAADGCIVKAPLGKRG